MNDNRVYSDMQKVQLFRAKSESRVYIVGAILLAFALFVLFRVGMLQIVHSEIYKEQAKKQYIKTNTTFDRGTIYFSNKDKELLPASTLVNRYAITANPTLVEDKQTVATIIGTITDTDIKSIFDKLSKVDDNHEELVQSVSISTKELVLKENLKGIFIERRPVMSYPQGVISAKNIGFVGQDDKGTRGMYGVERSYDYVLNRKDEMASVNFFASVFNETDVDAISNMDKEEGNVVLTIDGETSRNLHDILVATKEKWGSDVVGGIIMDPKTGEIIAMDSLPSYDPNDYRNASSVSLFTNEMVSSVYEMGSIIKPLTVLAAVDAGLVDKNYTYNDTGSRLLDTFTVRNYDGKARGITTVQTILDKSLNVGIVHLVEKLGVSTFQDYFRKFGLTEETGIDLPGEASGLTDNLFSNVFVDSATAGFGQGIAITPIQTVRSLSVLANGGRLVTPHVVSKIVYKSGDVKNLNVDIGDAVVSASSTEHVTEMLVHVVDTALLGGKFKMDRYSVAAKTGTAQIAKKGGGYSEEEYLHSFFGYFPAYDPKYIIFLFQKNPKNAEYASATLTEPFFEIVKFLIAYFEVPPDR